MRALAGKLYRDRRGTASLEAAVMLPLMALCWVGLFYFAQGFEATLDAAVAARRTAWTLSNAACEGEAVQYDCGTETGSAANGGGGWLDAMGDLPFVGWLFGSVFGASTTAVARREFEVPAAIPGGTQSATYRYTIMCNEKPMTVTDLLEATICQQFRSFGLSLDFAVDCPSPRHHDVPEACAP